MSSSSSSSSLFSISLAVSPRSSKAGLISSKIGVSALIFIVRVVKSWAAHSTSDKILSKSPTISLFLNLSLLLLA